jgi:hypothetical protein
MGIRFIRRSIAHPICALRRVMSEHLQGARDMSQARMGRGVRHPVPVHISYRHARGFETILAVDDAAAQELVQRINTENGTERHAWIGKIGEPPETARRSAG